MKELRDMIITEIGKQLQAEIKDYQLLDALIRLLNTVRVQLYMDE